MWTRSLLQPNTLAIESFLNLNQIDPKSTATIDFAAGRAMATLIAETPLSPSISIGDSSSGSTTDDVNTLLSEDSTSLFTWNGARLELILSFPSPTVANRLTLTPDDYRGYAITALAASADGSTTADLLAGLGVEQIEVDDIGRELSVRWW